MVNYGGNYRSLTSERVLGNRFAVSATHSLPSPTSFSVFCPSYPPQPAGATTLMRGSIRLLGSTLIYQLFAKLTAQAPSLSFAKGCQLSSHESTCSAATIFCPVQSETAHPSIHPSIHPYAPSQVRRPLLRDCKLHDFTIPRCPFASVSVVRKSAKGSTAHSTSNPCGVCGRLAGPLSNTRVLSTWCRP